MFFGIIEKLMVSQVSTGLTLKFDYRKTYNAVLCNSEGRFCFVAILGSAAFRRASFFFKIPIYKTVNKKIGGKT